MKRFVSVFIVSMLTVMLRAGEGDHQHDHGPVDLGKLGKVTFAVSCRGVQADFSRAVAMMHSFWYYEAERAFQKIAKEHPRCAMAQWGVAMANYHPIWAPPTPEELRRGRVAAEAAMGAGGNATARERDYIAAIHAFYADSDSLDHATRAARYEQAMAKVAASHPKDREASIFHALALLGIASPNDKTYTKQKQAAEVLTRVLPKEPEHPGVAHYIIHSFDYPQLANAALPAARTYAKLAPGSPHALHMPSHIFTRLGLWDESIASNIASAEKARNYVRQLDPNLIAFDELHAIDYLVYAYLQQGNDQKAGELAAQLASHSAPVLDLNNFAAAYAYAAVPARYAVERRMWSDAAKLELSPASFPWKNFPYAEAIVHFAKAVGGARSGDLNIAKASIDRLAAIRQTLADQKNRYWAEQVEIQRMAAQGMLAYAAGLQSEGLRLLRAAADLEDTTEKHPVTPGAVIPARELLAEMLFDDGKAAEALVEAEKVLTVAPGRYNTEWLAGRAAEKAADRQKAEAHYQALVTLAGNASRPEVARARSFVQR
jgi:hypothetical protein